MSRENLVAMYRKMGVDATRVGAVVFEGWTHDLFKVGIVQNQDTYQAFLRVRSDCYATATLSTISAHPQSVKTFGSFLEHLQIASV